MKQLSKDFKKRGILLTIFLSWYFLVYILQLISFLLVSMDDPQYRTMRLISGESVTQTQVTIDIILMLLRIAILVGIWLWKRIAVYLFLLMIPITYIFYSFNMLGYKGLTPKSDRVDILFTIIFLGLFLYAIKRKWMYFK